MDILNDLEDILKSSDILKDEPMSKHTSFKTGGTADFYIKVQDEKDLKNLIKYANKNKIQVTIVGNGTNLLVTDKGIRGIVINVRMNKVTIDNTKNKGTIVAEAGVPVIKLAQLAKDNRLKGLEFAVGIPGTIGGAIRMNAGAYGGEIASVVKETVYMDLKGNIKTIKNNEHEFTYRNSIFSKMKVIILRTVIELEEGNLEEIEAKMQENKNSRLSTQPLDKPNAGSTFKRGNGFITAKLIDECGLKGYKIGGAEVSTKHAGFIVNSGNATSQDILDLIDYVKKEVYKNFKVEIETEIEIIGET